MINIRPTYQPTVARLVGQLQETRTREVVDYNAPRDPETGHYRLKPESYVLGLSLGADLVAILYAMAILADHTGEYYSAADVHPLAGCSRSTANKKMAHLAELGWLKCLAEGRRKFYRIDI